MLNPKMGIFYVSFLLQFIPVDIRQLSGHFFWSRST